MSSSSERTPVVATPVAQPDAGASLVERTPLSTPELKAFESAEQSTAARTEAPLQRLAPGWMRVTSTSRIETLKKPLDVATRHLPTCVQEALVELVGRVEAYLLFHEVVVSFKGRELKLPLLFVSEEGIESADAAREWMESHRDEIVESLKVKKIGACDYLRDTINPMFDGGLPETDSLRLLLTESSRRIYLATHNTSLEDVTALVRSRVNTDAIDALRTRVLSQLPARDVLLSASPVQTAVKLANDAWVSQVKPFQERARATIVRFVAFLGMLAAAAGEICYDATIFVLAISLIPINYFISLLQFVAALALARVQQYSVQFNVKSRINSLRQRDIRGPLEQRVGDRLSPETLEKVESFAKSTLEAIERSVEILETASLAEEKKHA